MSDEITFGTLGLDGRVIFDRSIKRLDIERCRFHIMVPEHYWPDGTCKCGDAAHRKMMIKKWGYTSESFAGIPIEALPHGAN